MDDVQSLGKSRVALMEESFALLAPMGTELAERFYERFFERFPEVRPLFARTDMARQRNHFLSALVLTIDNLRSPELVEQNLIALGRRHIGYGAVPSHYQSFSSTLLLVLGEAVGDAWTRELEDAWSEGLRAISNTMMKCAAGSEPPQPDDGGS